MKITLYDTTLRDGAQREGISFSVRDKLNIARKLDDLGMHYIEGGWPGSNPKDSEFFRQAIKLPLKNAQLVAFGSTRRPGVDAASDYSIKALLESGVSVVTLVGKASATQVSQVLETTLEENLAMIADSVSYLKSHGLKVFLDAEHFFDGYKADKDYAIKALQVALDAGADCLVLCDTNGASLPRDIARAVDDVSKATHAVLGIHAHNDTDMAVANTLEAVLSGVTQVQGTINGYGERCGNANICSIIANLKLKMGIDCVTDEQLARLTEVSHAVSEIANLKPDSFLPYVGSSAFSHKGGLHVSGFTKWKGSYQHIDPVLVGNQSKVLVSELSGKSNIIQRAGEIGVKLSPQSKEVETLLNKVKQLESRGFQYENAEASFDLLVYRALPDYKPAFELIDYMVLIEKSRRTSTLYNNEYDNGMLSEAMVKIKVGGSIMHTVAEGNGPVNALDNALRKALVQSYPGVEHIELIDYKVRILDESVGTESQVRVLIESSDGKTQWRTVGSSTNIIEASWLALVDSVEYWLIKHRQS